MKIFKCTAHRVLAADSSQSEDLLHVISAEEGSCRFPPAGCIGQFFEIFLQCQISLSPVSTHGHQTGYGQKYRIRRAMERTPYSQVRIISMCHEACCIGFSMTKRNLSHHAVCRGLLIFAAKRHQCCQNVRPIPVLKHCSILPYGKPRGHVQIQPDLHGNIHGHPVL